MRPRVKEKNLALDCVHVYVTVPMMVSAPLGRIYLSLWFSCKMEVTS